MKIGKFEVADFLLEDGRCHEFLLKEIFGKIIILRAEHLLHKKAIEYIGLSELFQDVSNNEDVPKYNFIFKNVYDAVGRDYFVLEKVERND